MAAAVADWRVRSAAAAKIKKDGSGAVPPLALTENPDILSTVGHGAQRPKILVGFAAETNDVIDNGSVKLSAKAADYILANDVSPERGVMGGERNMVHVIGHDGVAHWPEMDKSEVAERLIALVAAKLGN
jgi:phosphopantothenoylcysteine decarboxylase / phosphopantothenate---cysteine ligase